MENPAHTANAQVQEASPFQKYDQLLHAGLSDGIGTRSRPGKKKNIDVLTLAFVKKYIQYAKARPAPALTKGAADWIVNVYASLRNDNLEDNKRRVSKYSWSGYGSHGFLDGTDDSAYAGDTNSSVYRPC